jgi:hypothetical protein
MADGESPCGSDILQEILPEDGPHAGGAVGAGLLLVGEDHHGGELRLLGVHLGLELGEGADLVVLPVGPDHGPVEPDVHGLVRGYGAELGGQEVLLLEPVLLVQDLHDVQLDLLGHLVVLERPGADQDVQLLGVDDLVAGLGHLVPREVGQEVGDAEPRVAGLLSDAHFDGLAVCQGDDAVQRQGDDGPLVLLDPSVVVGLEVCHVGGFEKGVGLEVEPGTVHVGDADPDALGHRPFPEGHQDEVLPAVVEVDLVAGIVLGADLELLVACLLGERAACSRVSRARSCNAETACTPRRSP